MAAMGDDPQRERGLAAPSPSPFSASEIDHMEQLLLDKQNKEKKLGLGAGAGALFDSNFLQNLAKHLNLSSARVGTNVIQIYQLQEWFQHKLTSQQSDLTHVPFGQGEHELASDTTLSNINLPQMSSDVPQDTNEKDKMPDLENLKFEARSSRDFAWYDIEKFLAHRISNGEVEVRVRYADFGADEDEWVNVKMAVRVRSIPLESSECMKVHAGDLVLCFREGSNEAVHYDAHVIKIERKLHDVRGCRCLFVVKYDHDKTEEKVHLSRLCRRPKF